MRLFRFNTNENNKIQILNKKLLFILCEDMKVIGKIIINNKSKK